MAEQPIADGDDWLEFGPVATSVSDSDGAPQAFILADLRTGQVREVQPPRSVEVETPLSLGPDGNVWFAGQNQAGETVLGELTADAKLRLLRLKDAAIGEPIGVASGSDGALWVSSIGLHLMTRVTRVNLQTAKAQTYTVAKTDPVGLLLPAVGGGFWTDVVAKRNPAGLLRINTQGQVQSKINVAVTAATVDGNGAVWGFDRQAGGDLDRVKAGGQVSQVTWYQPQVDRAPAGESAVLGADGRVWFTGLSSLTLSANEPQNPDTHDVLGVTGPDLGVQTWPTSFTSSGLDPTTDFGFPYLYPPLAAAPDGHLDIIESVPGIHQAGSLISVSLPDQPVMHPATLHLLAARSNGHSVAVRLSCSGQPGRVCAGTISVKAGAHTVARQTYGLVPGYRSTHTLSIPPTTSFSDVNRVSVTSVDPLAHRTLTRTLRLPPS